MKFEASNNRIVTFTVAANIKAGSLPFYFWVLGVTLPTLSS
jgi:hypothetical protein